MRSNAGSAFSAAYRASTTPLPWKKPPCGDPGDPHVLVRQLAPLEEHARDLEQRDLRRPGVEVARGGVDQARQQSRAQHGEVDRDRLGQPPARVAVRAQRRRVDLGEAQPDQRVLDPATQLLAARQRPEHRAAQRERERHVLEPEARHLLDDVDLARHVA